MGFSVIVEADPEVPAVEVRLEGESVPTTLTVDPEVVDFGNTLLGTTAKRTVTLSNASDFDTRVFIEDQTRIDACAADPSGEYCYRLPVRPSSDGSFELRGREQITIDIEYEPVVTDSRATARFSFTTCPACPRVPVAVSGIGVEQALSCDQMFDFGAVNPDRCIERSLSCTNVANAPVIVTGWQASGAAFTAEPSGAETVSPNESIEVDVEFCPTALAEYEGALALETGGQGLPARTLEVALLGRGGGPSIVVTPELLTFGRVATAAPATKRVLVTNGGFDPLQVTQVVSDRADFTIRPTGFLLQPGEQQVVDVTWGPVAAGQLTTTLSIFSNDQSNPEVVVPVNGLALELPPCSYSIAPESLTFGSVAPGNTLRRAVRVLNAGRDDCLIYDAVITQTGSAFSSTVTVSTIAPGDSALVDVRFAPDRAGTFNADLEISLSTPVQPRPVDLTGLAASGALLIAPSDVDFGKVGLDCTSRQRTITIYNTGSTQVTLTSIVLETVDGNTFALADLPTLPATLAAGVPTTFEVSFRPMASLSYAAAIRLEATESGTSRTYYVSLRGDGSLDPVQTDRFEQLGNPQADILFLVDNSCSMRDEQTSLANNFRDFIEYAQREAIDYRIAIVPLDNAVAGFGEFVGNPADRVITPQTMPDPISVFQSNVNLGAVGPGPEMGLEAAYAALTPPLLTTRHSGFLRRDAVLSLIVVSDQPDLSSTRTSRSLDFYHSFLLSIKGFDRPNAMSFSSIVGPETGTCQGPGGSAWPGPRYREMSRRTGGIVQSICTSDWGRALENLSTVAFGFRTEFFLTSTPVQSSIEVRLNGTILPAVSGQVLNWSYLAGQNAVGFSPFSAPEPGSVIEITYESACL